MARFGERLGAGLRRGGARGFRARRRPFALAAGLALAAAVALGAPLPSIEGLAAATPRSTAYMRFRAAQQGLPEGAFAVDAAPLGAVAPVVACAVVKAEDGSFFEHQGFDTSQMKRAVGRAAKGGPLFGASTLSQQLARNLFLSPERSVWRKLREAWLTLRLERSLPKARLLELYLNVVEWGPGVWGVGPASRAYFGRPPSALDAFDASFLAGQLAAPFAPLAGANLERAAGVQQRVLHQLYASDLLDEAAYAAALGQANALRGALAAGKPLPDALREARAAPPFAGAAPFPHLGPPLPHAEALAAHCGHARELAYRARFARRRAAAAASASP